MISRTDKVAGDEKNVLLFVLCGSRIGMIKVRAITSVISRKSKVRPRHGLVMFFPCPFFFFLFLSPSAVLVVLQGRLYALIVIAPVLSGDGKWRDECTPPPLTAATN